MFFDDEPLQRTPKALRKPTAVSYLQYKKKPRIFASDADIMQFEAGSDCVMDSELFPNYYLVAFKHIASQSYFFVQQTPTEQLDKLKLLWCMYRFRVISFNGIHYDVPIIEAAVNGKSIAELKELSDAMILRGERPFSPRNKFNHVDLIEVTPLQASLKAYAGRLHCERMQELPTNPHNELSPEKSGEVAEYCFNDLDNTELLFKALAEPIRMREQLSLQYGEDLRSKSDAQIAEAVIAAEFERRRGYRPKKQEFDENLVCHYLPPPYMNFKTPLLQRTLATITNASFAIGAAGYAIIPPEIDGLQLAIGTQVYRMSIGGLHSSETCVAYKAGEDTLLIDCDVASYYPNIILNSGIAPANMGQDFLEIYRTIVERRIAAKRAKNSVEADGLKITTNGTFGKLGNPYSIMYSPELMLHVTLTGQLLLLLLIEDAALHGFKVASANTDGVLFHIPKARETELQALIKAWEENTGFILEQTRYRSYNARDVNNYIAVKENGEVKAKGAYTEKGSALNSVLSKNPETLICSDAVKAFLAEGKRIEDTIRECKDIRRFVTVRNVKGGAHKNGVYLGKVIRWYYAKGETGEINYVLTGNKVPKSDGGKPLMELGDFPADLNYEWYEDEAFAILRDVGYYGSNEQKRLI